MTLSLVLSFVGLALLTVLALLWSRWPSWAKVLLVLGVTVFYFFADDLAHRMWGWPTSDAMPERFVLLSAVIDEPTARHAGGLYVWVNALEGGKPAAEPRAFRLRYSKDLHALLNEGMKKAREGVTQLGTTEPRPGKGGLPWLRPGNDDTTLKLRDMPVPQLPEK